MKIPFRRTIILSLVLILVVSVTILIIDNYVRNLGSKYIVKENEAPKADAILVLGAFVTQDGVVSTMLNDRLATGLELYKQGKASKLLVSGDHGRTNYDEVNAMKKYLLDRGAKDQDVFMDHAGFSTYESMYRARDIFKVKKVIIVTQQYHLMRAVFIARELGLEAYGVAADKQDYGIVMKKYKLRELAAREKDFLNAKMLKPRPKYLGEAIPVWGDGRLTNDR